MIFAFKLPVKKMSEPPNLPPPPEAAQNIEIVHSKP